MTQTRVVIVGGGFGGLCVARRLARGATSSKITVTIIDAQHDSMYTPWMHELSSGMVDDSALQDVEIPFERVRGVRFRRGVLKNIDRTTRHVICEDGLVVPYDILVLALGSVANDFSIPGVRSFAYNMKLVGDALHIRRRFLHMMHAAQKGRPQSMLVIGGGANGIEFASECAAVVKKLEKKKQIAQGRIVIRVMQMCDEILPVLPRRLSVRAQKRLKFLGVTIQTERALHELQENRAVLHEVKNGVSTKKVYREHFDCCVVALGVCAPDVIRNLPFATNDRGRILVDHTLRIQGEEAIFALGDCIAVGGGEIQTAQVAIRHARFVAKNISSIIMHRPTVSYKKKKRWDVILALGERYAIGTAYGIPVWGYTGAIIRRLIDARYFFHVVPFLDMAQRVVRRLLTYAKGDFFQKNKNVDSA